MSLLPCEQVVKELLPAIRADTASILHSKYHMSQSEIAAKLGVTQAAVSKYLSGSSKNKGLSKDARLLQMSSELAHKIAVDKVGKAELAGSVCDICIRFRGEDCVLKSPIPA